MILLNQSTKHPDCRPLKDIKHMHPSNFQSRIDTALAAAASLPHESHGRVDGHHGYDSFRSGEHSERYGELRERGFERGERGGELREQCQGMWRGYMLLGNKLMRMGAVAVALAAMGMSANAMAAPRNLVPVLDHAVNADVSIQPAGTAMSIKGRGNNALMVWKEFNVAKGASVEFSADKGQAMSFLNVVKGPGASYIDGRISANKDNINVFLVNPNGIHLGNSALILNCNQVGLSTNKPSQAVMDKFKQSAIPPIDISALSSRRGMGKIVVMNKIEANDIKIDGGHIVIGSIDETFSKDRLPKRIELNSSIDRIDIGGKLDSKPQVGNKTYREILQDQGYSAATTNDINASGTLKKKNVFVDHSKEIGIYDADQLKKVNDDLSKSYWLVDDIVVEDHVPIGKDKNQAFTGSFDGAFNTITYSTEVDKAGDYGLFAKLDGATVKNLKIVNSNVDTDDRVAGQKVNAGALAGSMNNSKISNVEVSNFDVLLDDANPMDKNSTIGALVGTMSGHNTFDNVMASFNPDAEEALHEVVLKGDILNVGIVAGKQIGTFNKHHVVVGTHSFDGSTLKGIGHSDNGSKIETSFADAAREAMAAGMSKDEIYASYAVDGSIDGNDLVLKHKTFLKPFYVEDFNYTYDGKDHNYRDLVNNEGFDVENLVSKTNQTDFTQHDAGKHSFELTTRKESIDNGHDYYFSYKYAGDKWDKQAGGDPAIHDRTNRHDGASGVATLNINKKKVRVDITDQTIADGKTPNLKPGKDTITNYDELINVGLVKGDKFDDLDLSLALRPDGTIAGSSNSKNYEVEINNGTLTVIKPPKPQPQPQPNPAPQPAPKPELKPQPMPEPVAPQEDITLPEVAKCSHCGDIGNFKSNAAYTMLPSKKHIYTGDIDYSSSIYAALDNKATSSDSEFNAYVLAHHDGKLPEQEGKAIKQGTNKSHKQLLAKSEQQKPKSRASKAQPQQSLLAQAKAQGDAKAKTAAAAASTAAVVDAAAVGSSAPSSVAPVSLAAAAADKATAPSSMAKATASTMGAGAAIDSQSSIDSSKVVNEAVKSDSIAKADKSKAQPTASDTLAYKSDSKQSKSMLASN